MDAFDGSDFAGLNFESGFDSILEQGTSSSSQSHNLSFDVQQNSNTSNQCYGQQCSRCAKYRADLERLDTEHRINFQFLKKKIISTDLLIRRCKAKQDESEAQNKTIEDLNTKLEQANRDSAILLEQLNSAVDSMKPLKEENERLEVLLKTKEIEVGDLHIKLAAEEAYKNQRHALDAETRKRENEALVLKKKIHSLELKTQKLVTKTHSFDREKNALRTEKNIVSKRIQVFAKALEQAQAVVNTQWRKLQLNGLTGGERKPYVIPPQYKSFLVKILNGTGGDEIQKSENRVGSADDLVGDFMELLNADDDDEDECDVSVEVDGQKDRKIEEKERKGKKVKENRDGGEREKEESDSDLSGLSDIEEGEKGMEGKNKDRGDELHSERRNLGLESVPNIRHGEKSLASKVHSKLDGRDADRKMSPRQRRLSAKTDGDDLKAVGGIKKMLRMKRFSDKEVIPEGKNLKKSESDKKKLDEEEDLFGNVSDIEIESVVKKDGKEVKAVSHKEEVGGVHPKGVKNVVDLETAKSKASFGNTLNSKDGWNKSLSPTGVCGRLGHHVESPERKQGKDRGGIKNIAKTDVDDDLSSLSSLSESEEEGRDKIAPNKDKMKSFANLTRLPTQEIIRKSRETRLNDSTLDLSEGDEDSIVGTRKKKWKKSTMVSESKKETGKPSTMVSESKKEMGKPSTMVSESKKETGKPSTMSYARSSVLKRKKRSKDVNDTIEGGLASLSSLSDTEDEEKESRKVGLTEKRRSSTLGDKLARLGKTELIASGASSADSEEDGENQGPSALPFTNMAEGVSESSKDCGLLCISTSPGEKRTMGNIGKKELESLLMLSPLCQVLSPLPPSPCPSSLQDDSDDEEIDDIVSDNVCDKKNDDENDCDNLVGAIGDKDAGVKSRNSFDNENDSRTLVEGEKKGDQIASHENGKEIVDKSIGDKHLRLTDLKHLKDGVQNINDLNSDEIETTSTTISSPVSFIEKVECTLQEKGKSCDQSSVLSDENDQPSVLLSSLTSLERAGDKKKQTDESGDVEMHFNDADGGDDAFTPMSAKVEDTVASGAEGNPDGLCNESRSSLDKSLAGTVDAENQNVPKQHERNSDEDNGTSHNRKTNDPTEEKEDSGELCRDRDREKDAKENSVSVVSFGSEMQDSVVEKQSEKSVFGVQTENSDKVESRMRKVPSDLSMSSDELDSETVKVSEQSLGSSKPSKTSENIPSGDGRDEGWKDGRGKINRKPKTWRKRKTTADDLSSLSSSYSSSEAENDKGDETKLKKVRKNTVELEFTEEKNRLNAPVVGGDSVNISPTTPTIVDGGDKDSGPMAKSRSKEECKNRYASKKDCSSKTRRKVTGRSCISKEFVELSSLSDSSSSEERESCKKSKLEEEKVLPFEKSVGAAGDESGNVFTRGRRTSSSSTLNSSTGLRNSRVIGISRRLHKSGSSIDWSTDDSVSPLRSRNCKDSDNEKTNAAVESLNSQIVKETNSSLTRPIKTVAAMEKDNVCDLSGSRKSQMECAVKQLAKMIAKAKSGKAIKAGGSKDNAKIKPVKLLVEPKGIDVCGRTRIATCRISENTSQGGSDASAKLGKDMEKDGNKTRVVVERKFEDEGFENVRAKDDGETDNGNEISNVKERKQVAVERRVTRRRSLRISKSLSDSGKPGKDGEKDNDSSGFSGGDQIQAGRNSHGDCFNDSGGFVVTPSVGGAEECVFVDDIRERKEDGLPLGDVRNDDVSKRVAGISEKSTDMKSVPAIDSGKMDASSKKDFVPGVKPVGMGTCNISHVDNDTKSVTIATENNQIAKNKNSGSFEINENSSNRDQQASAQGTVVLNSLGGKNSNKGNHDISSKVFTPPTRLQSLTSFENSAFSPVESSQSRNLSSLSTSVPPSSSSSSSSFVCLPSPLKSSTTGHNLHRDKLKTGKKKTNASGNYIPPLGKYFVPASIQPQELSSKPTRQDGNDENKTINPTQPLEVIIPSSASSSPHPALPSSLSTSSSVSASPTSHQTQPKSGGKKFSEVLVDMMNFFRLPLLLSPVPSPLTLTDTSTKGAMLDRSAQDIHRGVPQSSNTAAKASSDSQMMMQAKRLLAKRKASSMGKQANDGPAIKRSKRLAQKAGCGSNLGDGAGTSKSRTEQQQKTISFSGFSSLQDAVDYNLRHFLLQDTDELLDVHSTVDNISAQAKDGNIPEVWQCLVNRVVLHVRKSGPLKSCSLERLCRVEECPHPMDDHQEYLDPYEMTILQLIVAFIDKHTVLVDRSVLKASIWSAIFDQSLMDTSVRLCFCRLFCGFCKKFGDLEEARVLLYNIAWCSYLHFSSCLLAMLGVWPSVAPPTSPSPSPVCRVFNLVLSLELDEDSVLVDQVLSVMDKVFDWRLKSTKPAPQALLKFLVEAMIEASTKSPGNLFEYQKAVELLCMVQGSGWTQEHFVQKILVGFFQRCNSTSSLSVCADAMMVFLRITKAVLAVHSFSDLTIRILGGQVFGKVVVTKLDSLPLTICFGEVLMELCPLDPSRVKEFLHMWEETNRGRLPRHVLDQLTQTTTFNNSNKGNQKGNNNKASAKKKQNKKKGKKKV